MGNKKIMIIAASPRENGNTNTLVARVVETAEKAGASVTVFDTNLLDLAAPGCIACEGCQPDKLRCVLDDDLAILVGEIPKYDTIVFAAPVFFFGFPAQMKMVLDRLYSLLIHESGNVFSPLESKEFAIIATAGGTESDSGLKAIKLQMKYFASYLGRPEPAYLFKGDCGSAESAAQDPEALKRAEAFGKALAK